MERINETLSSAAEITGRSNWLQLFADEVPAGGGGDPAGGGTPAPVTTTEPAPAAAPAPAVTPELLDFGGRKIAATDPALRELHTEYQQQRAAYTRAQQELLRYKAAGTQPTPANPAPTQTAAQPTQAPAGTAQALWQSLPPEQRAEFQTALYGDDAMGAIEKFVVEPLVNRFNQTLDSRMQSVMPQVQQIQQQMRVQDELSALAAEYPDVDQHAQAMQQIIEEQPGIVNLNNGLKSVYLMAKAQTAQAAPTAAQIMQDPAVRQQIITESRNQIIQEYLASVQSGTAPVVLGAQPAAATPVLPANKPRTIDEAHRAGLAWLATQG